MCVASFSVFVAYFLTLAVFKRNSASRLDEGGDQTEAITGGLHVENEAFVRDTTTPDTLA